MLVGIDDISFHASSFYLPLNVLAERNGQDPEKYDKGLGQYQMGIPPLDEDIVTMGANAAWPLVQRAPEKIRTLLFATESGIDQSKSAGIYAARLLDLSSNMRIVELKQACYSATAALQMACAMVLANPEQEVLIIASDVARYGLGTPGEATQGCGAVAMRVTSNPRLLNIDKAFGCYSEDVMDFWRPNYMDTALVDGKFSTQVYLKALRQSWNHYLASGGQPYHALSHFCYHLPFGRMGEKAHKKLALINGVSLTTEQAMTSLNPTLLYNRHIGNSYAASLYIGLLSLIENSEEDLSEKNIGLFSYGSGCVGEFFSSTVLPEYEKHTRKAAHLAMLESRQAIDYDMYKQLFNHPWPTRGEEMVLPAQTTGRYRLAAIENHKRVYESVKRES